MGAIAGDLASVEEMYALKGLMTALGVTSIDGRQDGTKLHPKFGRASYVFNSTIAGIEAADAVLGGGAEPRHVAAVLNARLRKRNLKNAFRLELPVDGLHIAIVDDVVTTGSTVAELSRLLLQSGAASVQVWCLCRTL